MSARLHAAASLTALLALALAGCGTSTEAGEKDEGKSDKASATAEASPSSTSAPCPEDAKCYDFAEGKSGWADVDEAGYFAKQDSYLDGTFRMTAREAGTWNAPAPVKVTDLANDYGVKIDADAVMGKDFPANAAWGASCWTGQDGGGALAGFGVYVQPARATVGVWSTSSGEFKPLKSGDVAGVVKPDATNHLTMSCKQDASSGSVKAAIDVELNGSPVVSTAYDKGMASVSWGVDDGVGLLVAGKGGDVFFDNVVVKGQCTSEYC